jgi:hypothetical protein
MKINIASKSETAKSLSKATGVKIECSYNEYCYRNEHFYIHIERNSFLVDHFTFSTHSGIKDTNKLFLTDLDQKAVKVPVKTVAGKNRKSGHIVTHVEADEILLGSAAILMTDYDKVIIAAQKKAEQEKADEPNKAYVYQEWDVCPWFLVHEVTETATRYVLCQGMGWSKGHVCSVKKISKKKFDYLTIKGEAIKREFHKSRSNLIKEAQAAFNHKV